MEFYILRYICLAFVRSLSFLSYSVVCLDPFSLILKANCLTKKNGASLVFSNFAALFKAQAIIPSVATLQSYISYGKVIAKSTAM